MKYLGLHRGSALRGLLAVVGCWMFTMAWSSTASASLACVGGNLSGLIGTTCDIGSLESTLTGKFRLDHVDFIIAS